MFKQIKQDKKKLKTFKNSSRKSINHHCDNEINQDEVEEQSEWLAELRTKKKPKKRLPRTEKIFQTKSKKDSKK